MVNKLFLFISLTMTTYIPFTWSTYADKNVLIRDFDGYVSITKICEATGKAYNNLINSEDWKKGVHDVQASIMSKTPKLYYRICRNPYPCWSSSPGIRKEEIEPPTVFYEYTRGPAEYNGVYADPGLLNAVFNFCVGKRYTYQEGKYKRRLVVIPWKDEYELQFWVLNEKADELRKRKEFLNNPDFPDITIDKTITIENLEKEFDETREELTKYWCYLSRQRTWSESRRPTKIY
jgi:hypothetical protein